MLRMPLGMDLPLGLGLAMARRPEAMARFAALPEAERKAMADRARNARTKQEIQECVDSLV